MVSSPGCQRKKRVASPRGGRLRLASPSSPARMMKILKLRAGQRPQPGMLLHTIKLVVTILGDHW
jgi:hypothetical protein